MSDCSSMHSIWKSADHIFVSTENGLSKHKLKIFFAILKPILKFLYQNGKHGSVFFAVQGPLFSQRIKTHTAMRHHLSQHCTALPSLCPAFSWHSVNSMLMAWLLLSDGNMSGATLQWRAAAVTAWSRRCCFASQAGLHAACRLNIPVLGSTWWHSSFCSRLTAGVHMQSKHFRQNRDDFGKRKQGTKSEKWASPLFPGFSVQPSLQRTSGSHPLAIFCLLILQLHLSVGAFLMVSLWKRLWMRKKGGIGTGMQPLASEEWFAPMRDSLENAQ